MSLYSYYRISKPSVEKVPEGSVDSEYRRLRNRTFWGVTAAYALYYVCRMAMAVVKGPLIDGNILDAAQLGIIGSAFYFVYAAGKFANGFIADYCNIRRFMATGLLVSTVVNLLMGALGLVVPSELQGYVLQHPQRHTLSWQIALGLLPRPCGRLDRMGVRLHFLRYSWSDRLRHHPGFCLGHSGEQGTAICPTTEWGGPSED